MAISKVLDKAIKLMDESYPAWGVSYTSGYAGGGVNRKDRKYFRTNEEAQKFAEELKRKNYYGISISKFDNFYHTAKDAQNRKAFFSKQKQQEFAEYLKRQGAKNIRLSMAADPLNKGGTYYYVDWYISSDAHKAKDAAAETHYLFYRDIDGSVRVEKFGSISSMRSRADKLREHDITKIKEWTHAEWAREDFNKIYNKMKSSV